MQIIKLFITISLLYGLLYAKKDEQEKQEKSPTELEYNKSISDKKAKLEEIEDKLSKNLWLKQYKDYHLYKRIQDEQDSLKAKLIHLKRNDGSEEEISEAQKKLEVIKKQMAIYGSSRNSVFGDLAKVDEVPNPKRIDNPLLIFSAVSTIRGLDDKKSQYDGRLTEIDKLVELLKSKKALLQEIDSNITKIKNAETDEEAHARDALLTQVSKEITSIKNERDDYEAAISIYSHKSSEVSQRLKFESKEQLLKLLNIGVLIVALFLVSFLIKVSVKSYLKQNHEKSYIINKIIGVTTYILVFLTLLLSYIENVTYLVTILGFASAGIAIAMKDWFMSILGWLTIVSSGTIKVGDRIKISTSETSSVLGDVLDISPLKITIYEDVSLLSYEQHKRAGRVVFIPNNFIFSKMIFNYSHAGLQTVWDSVTIALTYDSNINKAIEIARKVVDTHTKAYSKLTEKQTHKMRANYSIRNYSVEPRIFTFVEGYGIALSCWFLTGSFSILSVKSAVSKDLFEALTAEDDIHVAYPTSTISFSDVTQKAEQIRLMGE